LNGSASVVTLAFVSRETLADLLEDGHGFRRSGSSKGGGSFV
jgi:hypothetical protein